MIDIPGPPPSAAGDNLEDIAAAGGLHTYQLRLHEEYGPVARFRLAKDQEVVSVADPVLLERTVRINKRPERLFEFLAPFFESGNMQTMPADEHVPWRRLVLSALGNHRSHEAHFDSFVGLTAGMADRWAAADGPIALQQELSELSLRMVCQYALGIEMGSGALPQTVIGAFEDVLTDYLARLFQVPSDVPEETRRERSERSMAVLRSTVDEILAGSGSGTGEDNLLARLGETDWAPGRIRDTVLGMMLAAHHTSGVAISWTLHLLAAHPEQAARLRRELDDVLGGRPAPAYGDLARMDYLERVVKESMRRYPPGPYGARETTEEIHLGDHLIPAGTTLFLPIWAVHTNPRYWPEPDRFDPDRFTPEASAGRPKHAYIPFGFGPRSCEGASLAMVELRLVLAMLLKRFDFHPVPGHTVTPVERFVLWAADDIMMTISPRSARR